MKRILALAIALVIGISGFAMAEVSTTTPAAGGNITSAPAKPAPQAKKKMHRKGHRKNTKAQAQAKPAAAAAPVSPAGK